ncbi:MAG: formylglycine-generating enzyme family protein [Dysgonamonadaceae bacterium]|jgi:formylglycine-generating enzyme required for sulfatase activity|nr:formylglycine-generating enzyme family protein [Dysgonamonadaceae bacterium]
MYSKTKRAVTASYCMVMDRGYCPNEVSSKNHRNKRLKIIVLGSLLAFCLTNVYGQGNTKRHPAEPEMVFVESGTFLMGTATGQGGREAKDTESPQHSVTVSSFNISKYVVTQGQWKLLMGKEPSGNTKGDNLPVENVSWNDAQEFIRFLNTATGKNYRLPTEAEWEYAARGGAKSKGYKYSGSNNLIDVAWFDEGGYSLNPVGTKMPNELGIYDMSGNVWEWCGDWAEIYTASSQRDPKGPSSGSFRVKRGGAWLSETRECRVVHRSWGKPNETFGKCLGFRLVLP